MGRTRHRRTVCGRRKTHLAGRSREASTGPADRPFGLIHLLKHQIGINGESRSSIQRGSVLIAMHGDVFGSSFAGHLDQPCDQHAANPGAPMCRCDEHCLHIGTPPDRLLRRRRSLREDKEAVSHDHVILDRNPAKMGAPMRGRPCHEVNLECAVAVGSRRGLSQAQCGYLGQLSRRRSRDLRHNSKRATETLHPTLRAG